MKSLTTLFAVLVSAITAPLSHAVPMRPMPTVTVTGTVTEAKWFPEETKKAMHGASGSLGQDRKFPAHFEVQLKDVDVQIVRSTGHKGGDGSSGKQANYRLRINSNDKDLLKPGMKIKVANYHVGGDEGGIWSKHDKVEILATPPAEVKK